MARQHSPLHPTYPARRPAASGFTLIEMSIVLVVIGLIVGGVLVGRDLIEIAQTRALIAQIDRYKVAVNAFRLKYVGMPGDLSENNAAALGFAARAGTVGQGNGNNLIERCPGEGAIIDKRLGCERVLFWRDLSDASMVDGSFIIGTDGPAANLTAANLPQYLPRAKGAANNGYVLALGVEPGTLNQWTSEPWNNYFVVIGITRTNATSMTTRVNVLTPQKVYNIDTKLDDGLPYFGGVRGWKTGNGAAMNTFFYTEISNPDCINYPIPGEKTGATYNVSPSVKDQLVCSMGFLF